MEKERPEMDNKKENNHNHENMHRHNEHAVPENNNHTLEDLLKDTNVQIESIIKRQILYDLYSKELL